MPVFPRWGGAKYLLDQGCLEWKRDLSGVMVRGVVMSMLRAYLVSRSDAVIRGQ